MENDFDSLIENAAPYSSIQSVFKQSIGGELDFKLKLDKSKVYLMNGVVYNTNEAGNFIWAYYLKKHDTLICFRAFWHRAGRWLKRI